MRYPIITKGVNKKPIIFQTRRLIILRQVFNTMSHYVRFKWYSSLFIYREPLKCDQVEVKNRGYGRFRVWVMKMVIVG